MQTAHDPTSLRERLGQLGRRELLGPEELALLDHPDVRALPHAAQWEFLRTNRRVGYLVTLVAGGVRQLFLVGGGAAALGFGLRGLGRAGRREGWEPYLLVGVGLVLLGPGLWLGRSFLRRVARLRKRLPPADELGLGQADHSPG
jgi:hypothetical protein